MRATSMAEHQPVVASVAWKKKTDPSTRLPAVWFRSMLQLPTYGVTKKEQLTDSLDLVFAHMAANEHLFRVRYICI